MALSGNLNDFDISYIIQIISQEGKSGKLIVRTDDISGFIIFKKGKIIYAETSEQNIETLLDRYCIYIKHFSESEMHELKTGRSQTINNLTFELLSKKYCTPQELFAIVEKGITSLSCELFFFKKGNYLFDTLDDVDSFQIGTFSTSADAITMEAMRRIDDWERIKKEINFERLFIHAEQDMPPDKIAPIENFNEYIYWLIDGTTSTKRLCEYSFLPQYLVFEVLFQLLQAGKIISVRLATQKATIEQTSRRIVALQKSLFFQAVFSSLITVLIIGIVFFFYSHFFTKVFFYDIIQKSSSSRKELSTIRSNEKIALGKIYYQSLSGRPAFSFSDLVASGFLTKRDFYDIIPYSNIVTRQKLQE
jgi:hypothetical protein